MVKYTSHCEIRMNQRGIRKSSTELVLEYADIVERGKFGRDKMMISDNCIKNLIKDGLINPSTSDKLRDKWIIIEAANDNEPEIVSAYSNNNKRIKSYKRKRNSTRK